MKKFVYTEFEIDGLDKKPLIASKGYLNTDYIASIPIPFKNRQIEIHTGCIENGITSGTKYYKLTKSSFDNLLKELGIEKEGK